MITFQGEHGSAVADPRDIRRIVTPGFCLGFWWTGDRWAHRIEIGHDTERVLVAESVEADALRDDPIRVISPAYQQLHFQEDPQGAFALLVGQFGTHHFSAAFRVTEEPGQSSVEIDVADRTRGAQTLLACTYVVTLPAFSLIDAGPASVVWDVSEPAFGRLGVLPRGLPGQPTELALAESGRRAAHLQALATTIPGAPTQRCRYRWTWTPGEMEGRR